jgi:hypothetical protein
MALQIQIIETQSQQVLFSCAMDKSHEAYEKASEFEQLGLDIKILHPSVNETLADSLGIDEERMKEFSESLDEEIEDHPGTCCFQDEEN